MRGRVGLIGDREGESGEEDGNVAERGGAEVR